MHQCRCPVLVGVALGAFALPALAGVFQFSGVAESSNGKELYEEQHTVEGSCTNGVFEPLEHRVVYVRRSGDGTTSFAQKRLDYSTSAIRPVVDYRQPDFGETLDVTYPDAGSASVVWQPPSGDIERSRIDVSDNLVVDAGFDNLVRRNWNRVTGGESIRFRFLAPTRGTDYAFILEPAQPSSLNAEHLVQIRPDNLVLGLLVDPIILGYNRQGALTVYSGLTNVRENVSQNHTATIRYAVSNYPECDLTP
ncbi:hypothetical protein GCM10011533_26890 [Streptosporangium jomthongense]|uniref:Uncharacterized protein n=1 Tax=Marinobacter aromaticivorans TaxID=1494078 RepID=A0ABW2IXY1_9GAMM|nr:hypothetical protein [Marinobacter aromaticivorans]GGE73112.1 hypothetical protein GCM10011533_26890 [Streptosporangium jomthongense]